jgi:hypothetical protein
MKIYLSHASDFDYQTELYEPLKRSPLWKKHEIFLPHDGNNRAVRAKDVMGTYDLLAAEASYPSTGQGIEIGLAVAAGVPIVYFYKTGTTPSSSLRYYTGNFLQYNSVDELLANLELF